MRETNTGPRWLAMPPDARSHDLDLGQGSDVRVVRSEVRGQRSAMSAITVAAFSATAVSRFILSGYSLPGHKHRIREADVLGDIISEEKVSIMVMTLASRAVSGR